MVRYQVRSSLMLRAAGDAVRVEVVVDAVEIEGRQRHTYESGAGGRGGSVGWRVAVWGSGGAGTGGRCTVRLRAAAGDGRVDMHVQTRGAQVDLRVERFDGHSRVVVRSVGGCREEFRVTLHAHDGPDAGAFEMARRNDGRVRFRWVGRQRVLGLTRGSTPSWRLARAAGAAARQGSRASRTLCFAREVL